MSYSSDSDPVQMRLNALSTGLRLGGVCVLHQDNNHLYDLAENLPPGWETTAVVGMNELQAVPEALSLAFAEAHDQCRASGKDQIIEFELGSGPRHYKATFTADPAGVTTVIADKTDERAHDVAVKALLREVSHRSKNLLAIVQSVAMQTALHSGDINDFLLKFRGRLHALSSTQDMVTESNWRGTYLQSLVKTQLARVGKNALEHVEIEGANPMLGPNASLHVGLAIHELGANATLHGALSLPTAESKIRIQAEIVRDADDSGELQLTWQETMVPSPTPVRGNSSFGTLVLERIVPLSVGGKAEYKVSGDSVSYRLVIPADQFEMNATAKGAMLPDN